VKNIGKIILSLLSIFSMLLLSRSAVVIAQGGTCLDSGNVICIDANGQVGIGTAEPNATLHVEGPVLASAVSAASDIKDEFMASIAIVRLNDSYRT